MLSEPEQNPEACQCPLQAIDSRVPSAIKHPEIVPDRLSLRLR